MPDQRSFVEIPFELGKEDVVYNTPVINDTLNINRKKHTVKFTKDFINDFAVALSKFDEVLLLDIYPARELPIKGVTAAWLLAKINSENKALVSKENLSAEILKSEAKIITMLGAGDIGLLVDKVKHSLEKKYNI